MTIVDKLWKQKVKEEKDELERKVMEACSYFTDRTDFVVNNIYVRYVDGQISKIECSVKIEI